MSQAARPSIFGFQTTLVEGTLRHDGRERTGCAELLIEPRTGAAIGIQSKKEPFAYSTTVFRDLDNLQFDFVAIDV